MLKELAKQKPKPTSSSPAALDDSMYSNSEDIEESPMSRLDKYLAACEDQGQRTYAQLLDEVFAEDESSDSLDDMYT